MSRRSKRIPRQEPVDGKIPRPAVPGEDFIVFSFKHLDLQNSKFSLELGEDGYPKALLGRLKDVSALLLNPFRQGGHSLHSHLIDFSLTTEPRGFSKINQQLWEQSPWQFAITTNKHGRVHGFLIGNTFYVVWLDPNHQLQPAGK